MSTRRVTKNDKIISLHKRLLTANSSDLSSSELLEVAEVLIQNLDKKITLIPGYGISRKRPQYFNKDVYLTINDDPWSAVENEHFQNEYNPCAQKIFKENINNIFYG